MDALAQAPPLAPPILRPGPCPAHPSSFAHRSLLPPTRSSIQSKAAVLGGQGPQVAGDRRDLSSRHLCRPYGPPDLFDSGPSPASFPEHVTLPSFAGKQRPMRRRWRLLLASTWFREEDPARPTSLPSGSAPLQRAVVEFSTKASTQPLLKEPARGSSRPFPAPPLPCRTSIGG